MAGYAAELQAQIAEKERRKKLQRQESLRQSQDLLAQRMTVPSGLVSLLAHRSSQSTQTSSIDQDSAATPVGVPHASSCFAFCLRPVTYIVLGYS